MVEFSAVRVVSLTCVLLVSFGLAINPGFKTRITDSGLNYAAQVGLYVLSGYIDGVSIPDQHGGGEGYHYDITGMKVTGFAAPNGQIQVVPGQGLSWNAGGGGLSIHGNWHYSALFIGDSGSFDASVSNLGFSLSVIFSADATGRPKIGAGACSCSIGDLHIEFHGGASAIYNLFSGFVADELKGQIQSQICSTIQNEINTDAEKALANIPVEVTIADLFTLDYRLVVPPMFTAQYMETAHKGEIYWKTNTTIEAPFPCPTMPEVSSSTRMVYVWVSDYVIDTLGYTAQTNKFLMYNLTASDLPPDSRSVLNTTCSGLKCIGNFIPEIGKKYPNTQVEVHLNSTAVPDLAITPTDAILHGVGTVGLYARRPANTPAFLVSLNATVAASVSFSVENETIHGKVVDLDVKLTVIKSDVGSIPDIALQFVTDAVLKMYLIPLLNKYGATGFPLPVIEGISFVNTSLSTAQDTVIVATDVTYKSRAFKRPDVTIDRPNKYGGPNVKYNTVNNRDTVLRVLHKKQPLLL